MPPSRRAATLLELLVAVALLLAAAGLGLRGWGSLRDRAATTAATRELAALLAAARERALAHGTATLHLDSASHAARLVAPGVPPLHRPLGVVHGVRLATTRDSIAFDSRGLGRGVANLRVILRRGAAAETLVVSRLGRVRR